MLYTTNLYKTGYISEIKFAFNLGNGIHKHIRKKVNSVFYNNLVLITLSTFCSKYPLGTGQVIVVRTAQTESSKELLNLVFLSIERSILNHLGYMLKPP